MNFSNALDIIQNGGKVRRQAWGNTSVYVSLGENTTTTQDGSTYKSKCMVIHNNAPSVYDISQDSIFATDWVEVE